MTLTINQTNFSIVEQSQQWFKVYDLGRRIYAITEPDQAQKVVSYLIVGDNNAILLDTGTGIGNIKKLVFELWSIYPIVINSNACQGHSGGNHKFNIVNILNVPKIIDSLTFGFDSKWTKERYNENTFTKDAPKKKVTFNPCNFTTISDGKVYSLGNKDIMVDAREALKVNGLMLVDHENKMLFTGDIFYQPLIDNLDANTKTSYINELKNVVKEYEDYDWFFSHDKAIDLIKKEELIKLYK